MLGILALTGLSVTLLCCALYARAHRIVQRYRRNYTDRADATLGELFVFIGARRLWPLIAMVSIGAGVSAGWWTQQVLLGLVVGGLVMRAPAYLIQRLRARRLQQLDAQLPDAVRAIAGGLRAGASLASTFRQMSTSVPPPLSQELALVLRQQRLGANFNQAMRELEQRVDSEAFTLLAVSLRVGGQTGGHLAATLDQVANTIQRRLKGAARMRTLTAQGRMQAVIVGALPILLLAVLNVLSPQAMAPLWTTPMGWMVLGVLCMLEVTGFWVISKIVRVAI